MSPSDFYKHLKNKFAFEPTLKQNIVLEQLARFVLDEGNQSIYLLKGYAGTGKTSIVGALVANLWQIKKSAVLMAPTGRAAKVISNYSKKEAFTIHKKIYFPKKEKGGGVNFTLQPNKHKNTIFIVDEASMISDVSSNSKNFETTSLLDDLMQYVYTGFNCKLLLIGDKAQLPPVKADISPALDAQTLELNYGKNVISIELDEVVRQQQESGILANATRLREVLQDEFYESLKFNLKGFNDIVTARGTTR